MTKYCITRNLNQCFFAGAAQHEIDACMAKKTYEDAWHCLEAQPHGAGHGGVGGIVSLLSILQFGLISDTRLPLDG